MNRVLLSVGCLCGLLAPGSSPIAQTATRVEEGVADAPEEREGTKKSSPWMGLPLIASSPKLGTSVGALGAYLHYFDPQSQVSMFGVMIEYTSTHSRVGGLFARTSFGADHHRLEGLAGFGYVENEYSDYLGTGQPFRTTDDLRAIAARYYHRFTGDWFVGAQTIFANYRVSGVTEMDIAILDILGVKGIRSGGIGAVVTHDSRDNQDMPTKGWFANLNNVANRDWLGADDNYDAYRLDIRWFLEHGRGHVFAVHQNNQFTDGAPLSAEASIQLRGYKLAQYLGKYMSSLEVEERVRFSNRWGATVFVGEGCLYGDGKSCSESDNRFPSYGAGAHFVVKPEDHMLLNLEYAYGNSENHGVYLSLGYAW